MNGKDDLILDLRNLKRQVEALSEIKMKVRNLEEDLHNRVRATEGRLRRIEADGDKLNDRIEVLELEIATLQSKLL